MVAKREAFSEEESGDNVVDIDEDNASLSKSTSGFASTSSTPVKPPKKRSKPPSSLLVQDYFIDKEAVSTFY